MPFTPYHFGPSGFVGLILRKWIDIPVFVLANVIVDIEIFFDQRYVHTLLIGAAAGLLWGFCAYPLKNIFLRGMRIIRIPYKTSLGKMIISGILGAWFHILIDGTYRSDVVRFWPAKIRNLWWETIQCHFSKSMIEAICLGFVAATLILYVFILLNKRNRDDMY